MTTSGRWTSAEIERLADLRRRCRRRALAADREQVRSGFPGPGHRHRRPGLGAGRRTRGLGVRHGPMVRANARTRNGTHRREPRLGRTTRTPTSNVADGRHSAGAARGCRRPSRPRRSSAAIAASDPSDLDRRARHPAALTRRTGADALGPGAHPGEAEVPVRARWRGSKPLPSSSTRSRHAAALAPDLQPDLACRGVLHDVVERFLGDPVERPPPPPAGAGPSDRLSTTIGRPSPALERARCGS